MNLSRITASIALVAYVLGGWLLPAAHHHAAHDDHHACEHARDALAAVTAEHSCQVTSHVDCQHSTIRTALQGDADAGFATVTQHTPTVECDGLCVLCQISARKFSASIGRALGCYRATNTHLTRIPDRPLSRSVRLSIDGPRGPPARLG